MWILSLITMYTLHIETGSSGVRYSNCQPRVVEGDKDTSVLAEHLFRL